jgi:hypothetical protein
MARRFDVVRMSFSKHLLKKGRHLFCTRQKGGFTDGSHAASGANVRKLLKLIVINTR